MLHSNFQQVKFKTVDFSSKHLTARSISCKAAIFIMFLSIYSSTCLSVRHIRDLMSDIELAVVG